MRHTTERGSERERILEGRLVSKIWKEVGNDRTASFVWRGLAGRGSGGESQGGFSEKEGSRGRAKGD